MTRERMEVNNIFNHHFKKVEEQINLCKNNKDLQDAFEKLKKVTEDYINKSLKQCGL